LQRLQIQYRRLDELGINYRRDRSVQIGEWRPSEVATEGSTLEWDITPWVAHPDPSYAILDDICQPNTAGLLSEPGKCHVVFEHTRGSRANVNWVALLENGREIARDTHAGIAGPEPRDLVVRNVAYILSLSACKAGSRYTVQARLTGDGGADSGGNVLLELRSAK
jgi:hexosaminidase